MFGAKKDSASPPVSLISSLQAAVETGGLDSAKMGVALKTDGQRRIHLPNRHALFLSDGAKVVKWAVPSLVELFRGDQLPPPDLDHYPPEYAPYFFFIEKQFLLLCDAMGDRTDQEMEEGYTALRRRPDGRSLGTSHDYLWQVVALLLGMHVLSAAEFEGIMGALLASTRRWGLRPVSRFYAVYLRKELGKFS